MNASTKKILCGVGIGAALAALVPLCVCVDDISKETIVESLTYKLKLTRDHDDRKKCALTISFPGLISKKNRDEAQRLHKEAMESASIDPEQMIGADGEDFLMVDDEQTEE